MRSFGEGIWIDTAPARILRMKLTVTMAVVELEDRRLVVYSPLALTTDRRAAVDRLGTVEHLYAPNLWHHLHVGEWAAAFPDARLHAPAGLAKKRPDLRIDRVHGAAPHPAFTDLVDEVTIDGFWLQEGVLVHRPSRTLLVADLVCNVGRPEHLWTAIYTKLMGFYDRVALSRAIRWLGFTNRPAARGSLDELLALDFDRLVVGHGAPLESGAHDALAAAYKWLRVAQRSLPSE